MKSGYKTTEFWLSVATAIYGVLKLPEPYNAIVGAVVAAAYAISRAMVKSKAA